MKPTAPSPRPWGRATVSRRISNIKEPPKEHRKSVAVVPTSGKVSPRLENGKGVRKFPSEMVPRSPSPRLIAKESVLPSENRAVISPIRLPPRENTSSVVSEVSASLPFERKSSLGAMSTAMGEDGDIIVSTPPQAGKSAIRVVVRTRPLHPHETADGIASIVNVAPDDATLHVTSEGQGGRVITKSFVFPKSLRPTDTQSDVFHNSGVKDLLDSALDGYAATVFAYGQTGSGKTYTMTGGDVQRSGGQDEATDGLIPRAAQYIFDALAGDFASSNAQEPDTVMSTAVPFESPSSPKASARGSGKRGSQATVVSSGKKKPTTSQGKPQAPSAPKPKPQLKTKVLCTFCEVYNEQVYDLLNLSEETLPVRWDAKRKAFTVPSLLTVECTSVEEFMMVVREGLKNRTIGSTALNKDSSRSHSLLTVYIERALVDDTDGFVLMKHGKVVFVDLAGSEREAHSGVQGEAAKETRNINLSLLSLGKVISVLASSKSSPRPETALAAAAAPVFGRNRSATPSTKPAKSNATPLLSNQGPAPNHIPYRDSKLTKLLMDSLGGSALTLMIACVSPLPKHLDDTLNTLNYATRASNIKNKPALQMDETELLIMNLRKEVTFLRQENAFLVTRLESYEGPGSAKSPPASSIPSRSPVTVGEHADSPDPRLELPKITPTPIKTPPLSTPSSVHLQPVPIDVRRRKSIDESGDVPDTAKMVKSYISEIERLRSEVKDLLERRAAEEDQYKSMTTENELLIAKVDGLEKDTQSKDDEIAALRSQLLAAHQSQPSAVAKATGGLPLSSVNVDTTGSYVPFDRRTSGPGMTGPPPRHIDSFRIGTETPINAALRGVRLGSMFSIDHALFADWDGDVERLKLALSVAMKRVAELQARLNDAGPGAVKTLTTKKFSDLLQTSREVFSVRASMTKGTGGFFSSSMPGPAMTAALHSMAEEEKKGHEDRISEITGPSSVCSDELKEYANSYEDDQFVSDSES